MATLWIQFQETIGDQYDISGTTPTTADFGNCGTVRLVIERLFGSELHSAFCLDNVTCRGHRVTRACAGSPGENMQGQQTGMWTGDHTFPRFVLKKWLTTRRMESLPDITCQLLLHLNHSPTARVIGETYVVECYVPRHNNGMCDPGSAKGPNYGILYQMPNLMAAVHLTRRRLKTMASKDSETLRRPSVVIPHNMYP
jgi:hypothetical protein